MTVPRRRRSKLSVTRGSWRRRRQNGTVQRVLRHPTSPFYQEEKYFLFRTRPALVPALQQRGLSQQQRAQPKTRDRETGRRPGSPLRAAPSAHHGGAASDLVLPSFIMIKARARPRPAAARPRLTALAQPAARTTPSGSAPPLASQRLGGTQRGCVAVASQPRPSSVELRRPKCATKPSSAEQKRRAAEGASPAAR